MTSEDLPRLQALVKSEADPVIKRAAEDAMLAILNGPKKEQEERDRDRSWLDTRRAVGLLVAIVVVAVGVSKVLDGSLTVVSGSFLFGGLTFSAALLGVPWKSPVGEKENKA